MLLALSLLVALHSAPTADSVTGKWVIKGDVVGNPLNATCDLKQSGTAITGDCSSEQGDKQPVTGDVKDGTVTFQYAGDYQGTAITIIYTGKFETATKLKGGVLVKPYDASGTFTAEPAK